VTLTIELYRSSDNMTRLVKYFGGVHGMLFSFSWITEYYKNKNWLQFLFIVKAAGLKQQISNFIRKFNAQKLAITFISVSGLS